MKYKAFQNFSNKDIYRDCVLVDLNENVINIDNWKKDEIIDPKKLEKGVICCDTNIATIVLLLNKKGYKTLYSCGGHYDENIDGTGDKHLVAPYIIFEPNNIEKFASYLLTLPNQFSLLIDSGVLPTAKDEMDYAYGDKKSIKKRRISIYSNIVYGYSDDKDVVDLDIITKDIFEKYNAQDIKDLLSWVNSLPNLKLEMYM
jgi:hypothetical protein